MTIVSSIQFRTWRKLNGCGWMMGYDNVDVRERHAWTFAITFYVVEMVWSINCDEQSTLLYMTTQSWPVSIKFNMG